MSTLVIMGAVVLELFKFDDNNISGELIINYLMGTVVLLASEWRKIMAKNVAEKIENEFEEEILDDNDVYQKPKAVYHDEIIAVVSIAAAILLVMSNFNMSGKVGSFVNSVLFGIFGIPAYISPIVLVLVVLIYLANRNNMFAYRKCVSAVTLLIVTCSLIQMTNYDASYKITQFYTLSASEKSGGGIVGGIVCRVLNNLFGFGGSIVILILLGIISAIIISEKTFIRFVTKGFNSFMDKINGLGEEDDYVEDDSYEEEPVEQPQRKRVAKTFTFIHNKEYEKDMEDSDDDSDEFFGEDDEEYIDDEDIENNINDSDELVTASSVFQQEINRKFGRVHNDAENAGDIRKLANNLINGTLEDEENNLNDVDVIADDVTFEQLTTDDVFDINSGKMKEITDIGVKHDTRDSEDDMMSRNNSLREEVGRVVKVGSKPKYVKKYRKPAYNLLAKPEPFDSALAKKEQVETSRKLQQTFDSFGVGAKITNVSAGPAVTRYEVQPDQGVKVSKITNLADDIKLNLAAADIRIEAPIPGKAAVGIEVPNKGENSTVMLRELVTSREFKEQKSNLAFAVGKDISGQVVIADIAKMPHLLIAGQTGAGKSVCINTLIMSLLYKADPEDVKLIMIDPKVVELSVYNGIPHLLVPVVTDPKKASGALNWAVAEMNDRYKKFAAAGVRDIKGFNEKVARQAENGAVPKYMKMPQIVIIVDELADLMMVAPGEVEDAICRLAQMARAAGLHLIIATQRPSVNVITGLIKANIPSRIAFSVTSVIDSRTIIDGGGAEKLLGKGDMLFYPSGYPKPVRVQGAFVSDKEVSDVVEYLSQYSAGYDDEIDSQIESSSVTETEEATTKTAPDKDEYFVDAGRFIIEKDKASIGMLQRVYKIGFNRAARIMDQLYEAGVVSGEDSTKPRKVLMTFDQFNEYVNAN